MSWRTAAHPGLQFREVADTNPDYGRLEDLLGYEFGDQRVLHAALTHASHPEEHNERLEFLGDAVLNLIAAEELYRRFPDEREGRLTQIKSRLVARRTLERVARRLGVQDFLRTGASLELRRSLPRSVLGNALEAILGAVYLDAGPEEGFQVARKLALRWLEPEFSASMREGQPATAKQILQLHAQREHHPLPIYRFVDRFEHPETAAFKVEVEVGGRRFPSAWGTTKKQAEGWAAWEAILQLRGEGRLEQATEARS